MDRKKLKTDKQFTPNWQSAASAGTEEEYEPPSSPLEEKIQKVWHEVLGQEKISVAADFFQIGGNSLRVSQSVTTIYLPLPCPPPETSQHTPTPGLVTQVVMNIFNMRVPARGRR